MDVNEILKMNPKSECKITYNGSEDWKNCYYQIKNDTNKDLDLNKLPVLDDEYIHDTGEPLYNDNNEEVFDPSQEIEYETYYTLEYKSVYKSKTFIGLLQTKIKELIDSGEYDLEDEYSDSDLESVLCEIGGWGYGRGFLDELTYLIGCNDLELVEEKEDDTLLWYTSSQLDGENGYILIEEI